jgi:hypothetical protein
MGENMKECLFKHITAHAKLSILTTSAEAADEEAKKLLANRKDWTLMAVREKSQGIMGNILG